VKLLTPEQVSEQLAVSRSTVLRLIADGALPAICLRSGRRKKVWRVRQEQLERWILGKEKQVKGRGEGPADAIVASAPYPPISRPANGEALD
jgi:excisionase family DNA binding protein